MAVFNLGIFSVTLVAFAAVQLHTGSRTPPNSSTRPYLVTTIDFPWRIEVSKNTREAKEGGCAGPGQGGFNRGSILSIASIVVLPLPFSGGSFKTSIWVLSAAHTRWTRLERERASRKASSSRGRAFASGGSTRRMSGAQLFSLLTSFLFRSWKQRPTAPNLPPEWCWNSPASSGCSSAAAKVGWCVCVCVRTSSFDDFVDKLRVICGSQREPRGREGWIVQLDRIL